MNKEELNITRYTIKRNDNTYCLYLIPDSSADGCLSFYIEKVGYGDLYHTVGVPTNDTPLSIEELIENNIDEWISIAEENCID